MAIDRRSPVPFYFQLVQALRDEIRAGRWVPGDRIPSEHELCETHEVSRSVVRQALARLEQEGALRREKGRGTFVEDARARSWQLHASEGFFQDEAARFGLSVSSRILSRELGPLSNWAADALGLERGSEGVTVSRVRSIDGRVALLTQNALPAEVADTVLALDADASLYEALEQEHGLTVHGGRRVMEAVTAGQELGKLLDVPPGAALAYVEAVTWDAEMRPFDCYQVWLRTDRTRIEVSVSRAPVTPAFPVTPPAPGRASVPPPPRITTH